MNGEFSVASGMAKESMKAMPRFTGPQDAEKAAAAGGKINTSGVGLNWNEDNKVVAPDLGDTATLSTTVSMSADAGKKDYSVFGVPLSRKSVESLIDAYKTALRGSRSHNQMLERFQQTMAANAMVLALSLMGVESKEIQAIQTSVRSEALNEIDARLSNDYARAKVTMKVTGEIPENA